jgi:hypothetical protein
LETRDRKNSKKKPFDHYLHGHPHVQFRTGLAVAAHFTSILLNTLPHCACESCKGKKRDPDSSSTPQTAAPRVLNAASSSPIMDSDYAEFSISTGVDDDGSPNVIDRLLSQAKQGQPMNMAITEPHSMHWLLEKEVAGLPAYLKSIPSNKLWTPRLGEIVLIARNVSEDQFVKFDDEAAVNKIWDPVLRWVGMPDWEAAVVTQVDKRAINANLLDQNADVDGFRVEPMSEVGNSNKAWSTRHKYVNHMNMRRFSLWKELLNGADVNSECHPTIRYALTAMSSLSVVGRYHFSSNGLEARVYCKGIYVGAEFIVKNDFVRFTSPLHMNSVGKDVIWIKQIYVSYNIDREPSPGSVHVEGVAYTTDPAHASGEFQRPIPAESLPWLPMRDYGLWYKMKDGPVSVPYTNLLTRLVEGLYSVSVIGKPSLAKVAHGGGAHHLGQKNHVVNITYGVDGVLAGREYSSQHDARINRAEGHTWYLGEDRVDQLDLHLINGQDVGDKARFGFEHNPAPLEQAHIKSMARARGAREKGVKSNGGKNVSEKELDDMEYSQDFVEQGFEEYSNIRGTFDMDKFESEQGLDQHSNLRGVDKFESEFTQRNTDADMDEFIQ